MRRKAVPKRLTFVNLGVSEAHGGDAPLYWSLVSEYETNTPFVPPGGAVGTTKEADPSASKGIDGTEARPSIGDGLSGIKGAGRRPPVLHPTAHLSSLSAARCIRLSHPSTRARLPFEDIGASANLILRYVYPVQHVMCSVVLLRCGPSFSCDVPGCIPCCTGLHPDTYHENGRAPHHSMITETGDVI